jgi:hypothetical protein
MAPPPEAGPWRVSLREFGEAARRCARAGLSWEQSVAAEPLFAIWPGVGRVFYELAMERAAA